MIMMSEKRFTFLTGASGVLFYDNEVMMPYPVVVDLLNSQSDALLSYDKLVNDLKEENEQLKSYIDTIFEGNTHICNRLNIENAQFYCTRDRDFHFPSCTYAKCFDRENLVELEDMIRECNE